MRGSGSKNGKPKGKAASRQKSEKELGRVLTGRWWSPFMFPVFRQNSCRVHLLAFKHSNLRMRKDQRDPLIQVLDVFLKMVALGAFLRKKVWLLIPLQVGNRA